MTLSNRSFLDDIFRNVGWDCVGLGRDGIHQNDGS